MQVNLRDRLAKMLGARAGWERPASPGFDAPSAKAWHAADGPGYYSTQEGGGGMQSAPLATTMRVHEKPLHEYPWYVRPFFWNQKRKYGQVLKPGLLWGRSPLLFVAVAILYGVLDRRRSPIDPVLRSLVTVRVSQINWCRFCVDLNSLTLAKRAGSEEKVEALASWPSSSVFDDRERVALEYAEAITYSDRQVTDELMEKVRAYFDEDAVVELTGLIAFQNLSSKFNSALDVPSQGFCKIRPPPS